MKKSAFFIKYRLFRYRKMHVKYFILILSTIIGILAGLNALALKTGVLYLRKLLIPDDDFGKNNLLLFIYPAIGIAIVVLFMKFILKDDVKHDITSILRSISKKRSCLPPHKMFSSIIGGLFTAGFGGSIGLESPIISSGAAIGSNIARYFKLNYKAITLLLACGAAGAIAAIFNTPVAAVVFALEVLLLDLTRFSLIPLLMSSVSGAVVTKVFYHQDILFDFKIVDDFSAGQVPFYLVLAVLTGLISIYFSRMYLFIENKFTRFTKQRQKFIVGTLILGVLIFIFPSFFGEGFGTIKNILSGNYQNEIKNTLFYSYSNVMIVVVLFFLALILLKVVAVVATNSAGGVGGIFAPSLFTGAITGFLFAFFVNSLDIGITLSVTNFALVGMAGVLAGVLHAPLTGIFLIAEITSGYGLFVPLMLCSSLSYVTVKAFIPESIITKHLRARGELITHHKDKAVLSFMKLNSVIETNFEIVNPTSTLRELIKSISKSKRNLFPVVDKENFLHGVILLDNIREIMFDTQKYDEVKVYEIMTLPPTAICLDDKMEEVMNKFNETGAWNLPVTDNGNYVGFVSKSKMFEVYRKHLVEISDD